MKKSLWMLGMAVAALTSCTNDEVVEMNQSNAIQFESFVNKGTRAVSVTDNSTLSSFYVFGYHTKDPNPVFENIQVTKTETVENDKIIWETQDNDAKNWTANTYYFGAYAGTGSSAAYPLTGANGATDPTVSFTNAGTLTIANYTVSGTENDLVAAVETVDNSTLANHAVNMEFKHLLSQVKFQFINNSNYFMTVSNITFKAPAKGTCTINQSGVINWDIEPTTTLDEDADLESFQYTYPGTTMETYIEPGLKEYVSDAFLVLPQSILLNTENLNSSDFVADFVIEFYERLGTGTDADPYVYNRTERIEYNNVSLLGTPKIVKDDSGDEISNDGENVTAWTEGYIYNYKAYFPANPSEIKFTASVGTWQTENVDDNLTDNKEIEF